MAVALAVLMGCVGWWLAVVLFVHTAPRYDAPVRVPTSEPGPPIPMTSVGEPWSWPPSEPGPIPR